MPCSSTNNLKVGHLKVGFALNYSQLELQITSILNLEIITYVLLIKFHDLVKF